MNQLKGVILAGGTGSRLYPLTKVTNKHLLPVGRSPMIFHAIQKLVDVGITDIMIVTGVDHMGDMVSLLGSGKNFQCQFTYRVQDEAGGIAQALYLAKDFAKGHPLTVILGDNIFKDSLHHHVQAFLSQEGGARLVLKEVDAPERFGVASIDGDKLVKIIEKPDDPESNLAVTGVYFYDEKVFSYIETCKPSDRGELEITDVNNAYIQEGTCYYDQFEGWWSDAGTFDSLEYVNHILKQEH